MFIGGKVSVCFSKKLFAEKVGEKIGSCLELTRSCEDAKTTESLCNNCMIMQKIVLLIRARAYMQYPEVFRRLHTRLLRRVEMTIGRLTD